MNITISVDDKIVAKARETARRRGESLNALIRQYLETLVGEELGEVTARELLKLMQERGGRSSGREISRESAYEGRV